MPEKDALAQPRGRQHEGRHAQQDEGEGLVGRRALPEQLGVMDQVGRDEERHEGAERRCHQADVALLVVRPGDGWLPAPPGTSWARRTLTFARSSGFTMV
jgi:hypothetical protein